MGPLVELRGIRRVFRARGQEIEVLRGLDLVLAPGERLAIRGESGAGKSTLLAIVGLVDADYGGEYRFDGRLVHGLGAREAARIRLLEIGIAFQDLHLVPSLTALENVQLPALAAQERPERAREAALTLLADAGLAARADHRPGELSGGERRRVALARALVNHPRLVLLDEPTAELDPVSAAGVRRLIRGAMAEGAAILAVTHDEAVAALAGQTLTLVGGVLRPGETVTGGSGMDPAGP